ncbi:TolC family protein [Pontibacter indicus]|uniref:Outer membrane efflux protein n=1 Tax=Pontibacter indicus TaxID=1317125 RepID=A0A1R3X1M9_9BACT|nr:TolC family protein [Pontibacter indicus]SIT84855.1 Outer membrane efflux protein [Pontibacter indicus]
MKKLYLILLLFVTLLPCLPGIAQPATRTLRLQEVIALAQEQSATARQAETSRENSYWQWRSFKSDYKPQLSLTGTLPDFSRTIMPVTQPDGTTDFKPVSINNSELGLSLNQVVSPTGGRVFVTSLMQRFDDFDRDQTRYNGNPAIVGIEQPLFAYNELSWAKKIEPLRYQESQKVYLEEREKIAVNATRLYFDLLLAQTNQRIASQNQSSNDTLYQIAQEKYKLGRLSKNDLLQLRLAVLNAELAMAQAALDQQTAALALKTYIGMKETDELELLAPEGIPATTVLAEVALAEARKNRKESINFSRRLLEAEAQMAKAQGDNGLNASLFATFGLTNRGASFTDIYTSPENQQRARIGFSMPILDWGRQRSIYKVAELNKQLVQYTVDQEEANFEQAVLTQVNQYNTLKARIATTAEADAIAQERYEIARNTFLIGRISITDLNIALAEKDQARRAHIASLSEFWTAHYMLRQLTLFDFEQGKIIE